MHRGDEERKEIEGERGDREEADEGSISDFTGRRQDPECNTCHDPEYMAVYIQKCHWCQHPEVWMVIPMSIIEIHG